MENMRRAKMNTSDRTKSKVTTPVLLCRLCHCEFTNFKEHVKSLVHLDARETKTTPKPPIKNKASFDKSTISKKVKMENNSKQSNLIIGDKDGDMINKSKDFTSVKIKTEYSTNTELQDETFLAEDKAVADLNGTAISTTDNQVQDPEPGPVTSKVGSQRVDKLTEVVFLEKHWHCKLCDCVQCAEDGSFDEHACNKGHQEALSSKLLSLRQTVKVGDHKQWLINCSACAFQTNDKAQFVSHLQTELHDHNLKNIIHNAGSAVSGGTLKNPSMKGASEVHKANTRKASSASKNITSKSATHQAEASKSTSGNSSQGKAQRSNGAPHGKKFPSSIPKPLMSLSIPVESWDKNKTGRKSTSTVVWDHSSSKPGILGEYRPDSHSKKIGFDGYSQDDWLSRPTDLQYSDRDPRLYSKSSSSSAAVRPTYSEVNQLSLRATSASSFEPDSTSLLRSEKYDSVWRGQMSLTPPIEKLNAWAFEPVEQEYPARHLHILTNLLTSQQTGTLPSTVSLDLASNSSFKLKQSSQRGTLLDNYSTSMFGASKSDFSRNNMSGMNFSSNHSRFMYSRR